MRRYVIIKIKVLCHRSGSHRTVKQNDNSCPVQDSSSLAVFKVTDRDHGHYKGPSGAFVTYCNISCLFYELVLFLKFIQMLSIPLTCCCCVIVLRPRLTSKVVSERSVNLTALFLGRLRPP